MATRIQVRRLANPRKNRTKRRNATKRRKLSPKQIRFFGSKAQKAGLKRRRQNGRRKNGRVITGYGSTVMNPGNRAIAGYGSTTMNPKSGRKMIIINPRRKRKRKNPSAFGSQRFFRPARKKASVSRTRKRRRTRRSNPALVVTLGALNPRRKRRNKPMATRKNRRRRRVNSAPVRKNRRRRRNPVARRTNRRRRRNPTRVVVLAPKANRRRRNSRRRVHHRRRVNHRRRNPIMTDLFGAPLFGKNSMEIIGGAFAGLVAAKFIPTLLPTSMAGGITSSSVGKVVVSGIAAIVGGWAGSKVSIQFGQGMLLGGMVQTISIALNAFLPTFYTTLNPSLGDLMNGGFTVPQNPLRLPAPPPVMLPAGGGSQTRMPLSGLARAYGSGAY